MKTTDEAVPIILDALAAGLQEDWPLAYQRWADACAGSPRDGYTAACAVANVISRVAASRSLTPGPIVAEVFRTGDSDPAEEERVALVAAFIAAQGNRDQDGTFMLFQRLLEDDDEEATVAFLTTLFEITVATVAGMRDVA